MNRRGPFLNWFHLALGCALLLVASASVIGVLMAVMTR